MVLKPAGFSQLLSKQLVFMVTWQTSPVWRMSPRLPASAYISHDAHLPFKDMLALFSVSWARLGFLHRSPVSDYLMCLWGNACTPADRPGVDLSFLSFLGACLTVREQARCVWIVVSKVGCERVVVMKFSIFFFKIYKILIVKSFYWFIYLLLAPTDDGQSDYLYAQVSSWPSAKGFGQRRLKSGCKSSCS